MDHEVLTVPAAIDAVILDYDSRDTPFSEFDVQGALTQARSALQNPSESENAGAWAEVLAFALAAHLRGGDNPWGTYFGPMGSGTNADGTAFYAPDIAGTSGLVIEHWADRAKALKHPFLRARYADLAWDMAPAIAGSKRNPENAHLAIQAYLDSSSAAYRPQVYDRVAAIGRALDLAIQLRDLEKATTAKNAFMALHDEMMEAQGGQWAAAFDRLMQEKNAGVTDADRAKLVADLEAVVTLRSNIGDASTFNPHDTQFAAQRLIKHYRRLGNIEDAKRLYVTVAKAFEHFASLGDPMLASSLLQTSVDAYRLAGFQDESRRVRVAMQEMTEQARGQMKEISAEIEIMKDDMEAFLVGLVKSDLPSSFARIASEFLSRRERLESQVQEMAQQAPLMAHIGSHIMSDDHVVAVLGSVEEDPVGHLIRQANMMATFSSIWLHQALARTMDTFQPVPEHFAGWANRHEIFGDTSLLVQGVYAWLEGDFTKAIHVLVPQIETALRGIVGQLGRPTTKAHPTVPGASVVLNMGDILYNEDIKKALGPDIALYFTAHFADPRGLNLRNQLAHGLLRGDDMTESTANLLIHTLLLLGVWKELEAARRS